MDLAELKFVVDTTQLKEAAKEVEALGVAVNKVNKPVAKAAMDTEKLAKAQAEVAEKSAKAALAQHKLEQAQTKVNDSTGKSTSVLERQNMILGYMATGLSKGQASYMATAKSAGALDDELGELLTTLKTQRTLIGGDPFDKSIGLMQKLTNETKIVTEVNNLFNRGLNLTEKQMVDLAREHERLTALYNFEGKSLDGLAAEYDQIVQKSVEINQANDARTNSMKAQVKAQNDAAKANEYIAKEMERVNRLTESNGNLTGATNNKLIRFEKELKASGRTAAEVATQLDVYKAALLSTQKAAGNRQVDYLSRALGPQITDIFVGLATGQAPLTILLQQGGQLRDQFALAGVAGADMGKMLIQASKSMISSVKDVGVAVGQVLVGAFTGTGKAIINFGMELTNSNAIIDRMKASIIATTGVNSVFVRSLGFLGTALAGVSGGIVLTAIASIGALGVAYFKASKEQDALTRQLALTGGSLGLTTAGAVDMAQSMNAVGVSTGAAISVITAMAKEGGFVAKEISVVTKAAVDMQKYAGIAIEDTVKAFSKMKEKPVEALFELAKTTGMVSPEITKMVMELVSQGKSADATAVAIKTLADVNAQQVARMKEDYTGLSLAMIEMGSSIKKFFDDTFKSLFFKVSPEQQLKDQIAAIDDILGGKAGVFGIGSLFADKEKYQTMREELTSQLNLIQRANAATQERAAEQIKLNSHLEQFNGVEETFATNKQKREKEIAETTKRNQTLIAAGLITQQQHEKQIAAIREKYKDPVKPKSDEQKEADRLKKSFESSLEAANKFYQAQVVGVNELTKSEIALNKVKEDNDYKKFSPEQREQIDNIYKQAKANELLSQSEKDSENALELKNKLLGKSEGLGKEYYNTIKQINELAAKGKFGADEVKELTAALQAATPEARRLAATQASNAKILSDIAAERAIVAEESAGDFKTEDEKASIRNLSQYRKSIATADAEFDKQIAEAGANIDLVEFLQYKEIQKEKKALAKDRYDSEQRLLTDSHKQMQAYTNAFQDLFKGMGDAMVDFALTGKTSFGDMVQSILIGLIKMQVQMQMMGMLQAMGGGKGLATSLMKFMGAPVPSAKGNVFDGGLQAFAKGGTFTNGIVSSPTMFNMGLMGEAGPEAIMPLRRGSDGSLGVAASGGSGGNVSVQVINNSNAQATTNETVDSKGNRKIEVVIGDMTAGEISRSGSASQKSIRSTFGIQPQLIRR